MRIAAHLPGAGSLAKRFFCFKELVMFTVMLNAKLKDHAQSMDYHTYIASQEWASKSDAAKIRANNRCQLCSASGLVVDLHTHHNTYERLGNERDTDLVVLCAECHERFHKNGGKPGNKVKISPERFSVILKGFGITFDNNDPYRFYELGKQIIQQIVDGFDSDLYDYYNKINIHILDTAIENSDKRDYEKAKENDFYGYGEYCWRADHDYWKGWKK
jgi:hypothetical protein